MIKFILILGLLFVGLITLVRSDQLTTESGNLVYAVFGNVALVITWIMAWYIWEYMG